MLLIRCPWCGMRDETEFAYGGQAHLAYPKDPHALSDEEWGQYLFMRDNPKGMFDERWVHSHGCRRWFNAARHTVTHEIRATWKPGEPRPAEAT
ncbi:MAG: sarcosine oxidase subunit delta [Burkholderiales bacterium]